ncbi:Cysteine protease atg4c [Phytophthora boehmeriae]|uniref:Cysteine protease n=1 Tax=Phytophthora boehmeriae TaxID=109152 RepID=A0A8T1X6L9_9STRA|nr:Cysteine protease atg4c [Phytophthora boehmeriae]
MFLFLKSHLVLNPAPFVAVSLLACSLPTVLAISISRDQLHHKRRRSESFKLATTLEASSFWDALGSTTWDWLGGELLSRMSQFAHGISALDVTPSAALSAPVWLLGRRYDDVAAADFDAYKRSFEAILWFTYRRDFPQMTPYEFTSDAGWGCMLRSAQMLLGQALQRRVLGREWRLPALFEAEIDAKLPDKYVQLLRWFADDPDLQCRYSIHQMVKLGIQYDKLPGEWYGPTTAAQVLRDLVNLHRREFGGELAMYVPQEGVVYSDDVTKLCVSHIDKPVEVKETTEQVEKDENAPEFFDPLLHPPTAEVKSDWSTALLILIPLRLGLDHVNEGYIQALKKTFTFPQSVGIIGGKKGHSVYFVGTQEDQLHLLDPHDVHPAPELTASFPTATHLRTVHSSRPLVMNVTGIDPSLALGFLCETRLEYEDFERRVRALHDEVQADGGMCPFSVASQRPDYADLHSLCSDVTEEDINAADGVDEDNADDDEYVLI